MADDVIVMYAAQGVEYCAVDPLFDGPRHPYTQGLFASRPTSQQKSSLQPIKGSVPPLGAFPTGCHFHPRCPFVMEKCKTGEVPLFSLPGNHRSRCWLDCGSLDEKEKNEHS
jgi:oligopeptide/dipeptide ABC transporter ATP-binding protein